MAVRTSELAQNFTSCTPQTVLTSTAMPHGSMGQAVNAACGFRRKDTAEKRLAGFLLLTRRPNGSTSWRPESLKAQNTLTLMPLASW